MTARLIYFTSASALLLSLFAFALPVRAQATDPNVNPNGLPDSALVKGCALPGGGLPPVSVGQTSTSGIFVPVNDSAVMANTSGTMFNTGMLVYKECVLRETVDAQRHYVTAVQTARSLSAFQTGHNGNPLYQVNPRTEPLSVIDQETERRLSNSTFDTLNPAFRDAIKQATLQGYARSTRRPTDFLTCPYQGDLKAALHNNAQGSVLDAMGIIANNPGCNPFIAEAMTLQTLDSYNASALANYYAQLSYGQGIYPRTITNEDGDTIVTTPASLVRSMNEMFLQSGYQQNQHANNVNEMVSGLFANIATQVISSNQGLGSLFQPLGGGVSGPSYLATVVQQAANGITQSNGNAALQILNAALAVEVAYNQAISAIANTLTQGIGQLRNTEKACWVSLIQNVCKAGTLSADGTHCTDTAGNSLTRIATSTQFSQAVVVNQISPLASSTLANLAKSNTAITLLNQIIAAVASNPNAAQQAAAIAQYNALVSQGAFHTQTDVSNVQNQQGVVTTAVTNLLQNIATVWTGTDANGSPTIPWDQSISPGTGWCNFQNQPTLALWDTKWK